MNNLYYIYRYLLKARGALIARVLSITIGLVIGVLVFSYVGFKFSYDKCFSDSNRIYQLRLRYNNEGDETSSSMTSAAIAPTLAEEIFSVESATRLAKTFHYDMSYEEEVVPIQFFVVDTSFFDIFDIGVIQGQPKEIFLTETDVMISESLAKTVFGNEDPINKAFINQGTELVVKGVFENPPINTHFSSFNMLVPINMLAMSGWDLGWNGSNFNTYVKLRDNSSIQDLELALDEFFNIHDMGNKSNKLSMDYFLVPLTKVAIDYGGEKRILLLLIALGVLALFIACLNYMLLSISTLVSRGKNIAMLRCSGANRFDIIKLFMCETAIIMFISLILCTFLVLCLNIQITSITSFQLNELFSINKIWIPAVVMLGVFLLAGLMPSYLFSSIPINAAFNGFIEDKSLWKHTLLFIQLSSVSFVLSLLLVISFQFNKMQNSDMGYNHDGLVSIMPFGNLSMLQTYKNQLNALPEVQSVGVSYSLPIYTYSTIECYDEITGEYLFSSQKDEIDYDYIPTMGMTIVDGKNFDVSSPSNHVIVNEEYVKSRGWRDNIIGKTIIESNAPDAQVYTIIGVVKNFMNNSKDDIQPLVFHNIKEKVPATDDQFAGGMYVVIKLSDISSKSLLAVSEAIKDYWSTNMNRIDVYDDTFNEQLNADKSFQKVVLIVSILTLMITVIGLIGYLTENIQKRKKEIAIRKVNGASVSEIIQLLALRILKIAGVASFLGAIISYSVSERWLSQFSNRVNNSILFYIASVLFVLVFAYSLNLIKAWKAAHLNPFETIKM